VKVGGQTSSHLITLPLTQRVQLIEASTSKLQVVVYEIILVERRTISDARTQHLYTCTRHTCTHDTPVYTQHTCTKTYNTQVVVYEIILVERRTINDARTQHLYTCTTHLYTTAITRHTCTHDTSGLSLCMTVPSA